MRNVVSMLVAAVALAANADPLPDLPVAVSNNAMAVASVDGAPVAYSFAGIGGDLEHGDIHAQVYRYQDGERAWQRVADVPGGVGRLAASAVTVGNDIYFFGGYQVFDDGSEVSLPDVYRVDPATGRFERRADMPVPVDDAVALVHEDRYIYLVSGWHDLGNVNLVQRYDTSADTWTQATPWPGPPVFGHVGAISAGTLVVCDGVRIDNATQPRRFVMSDVCYLGEIDTDDARRIHWREIPPHPGAACYRATAVADSNGGRLLFAGGGDNPYNYNGVGYNGIPAKPCRHRYSFLLNERRWLRERDDERATMDHRALLRWNDVLWLVGGLEGAGAPTAATRQLPAW
ncbi:MAG: galactose oxidase [Pseudomonadota bacterium]